MALTNALKNKFTSFSRTIQPPVRHFSSGAKILQGRDYEIHRQIGQDLFNSFAKPGKKGQLQIGSAELRDMMSSLGAPRSKEVLWDIMMELDRNRNGRIDLEEFLDIEGYNVILKKAWNANDIDDIFQMLDQDGSGDIDVHELSGLLLTTGGHISQEEAEHLVDSIDIDKDGTFDKEELEKFLKQRPGWLWKLKAAYKSAFIIGPPGSGKGVLCAELVNQGNHYIKHVSSGDLLRREVELQTPLGLEIKDEISQGKLVPSETIVKLLRKFLTQEASGRFTLIDGFPRSMDNLNDFIQICGLPTCAIILQCPDEIVLDRIVKRGMYSDRADDNAETAMVRIESYHNITKPLISKLRLKGVDLIEIDSTLSVEENTIKLLNNEVINPRVHQDPIVL